MLFWNNDYSRGLAGHMRPVTYAVRPASAQGSAAGCVIFRPMDWWSRIVNTENIPVFRGEKIKMSTISHCYKSFVRLQSHILPAVSAELPGVLMFWNPVPGPKGPCRACVRISMYSGL